MDILKTLAVDIQHSVFNNNTTGILYVTRDVYEGSFVVAVPVYSFSAIIRKDNLENDCKWVQDHFPGRQYAERLIEEIKRLISEFEY